MSNPDYWNKVMNNSEKFIISPGCKTQVKGMLADFRVDRDLVPFGWHAYDVLNNEYGTPIALSQSALLTNFGGTFLTRSELNFNKSGLRYLNGRGGYTYA